MPNESSEHNFKPWIFNEMVEKLLYYSVCLSKNNLVLILSDLNI